MQNDDRSACRFLNTGEVKANMILGIGGSSSDSSGGERISDS